MATWRVDVDSLSAAVTALHQAVRAMTTADDLATTREAFARARDRYKTVELALEYYTPSTARELNGPALPEVEETEGPEVVVPPTGFQVVEELLFDPEARAHQDELIAETGVLVQLVTRAQTMFTSQQTDDAHVWDAAKLQLARLSSLGIAGFDSPIADRALTESEAALFGIERALATYRTDTPEWRRFDLVLDSVRRQLRASTSRATLDHFGLLRDGLIPLGRAMQAIRVRQNIGVPVEHRGFRMDVATLFDSGAFDPSGFAPFDARGTTDAQVALGRALFFDVRLSGSGTRSCGSCHLPERGFTDGLPQRVSTRGARVARNTPTVINSGVQVGAFADLRTTYLEDQVTDVVQNADEMHGSLAAVTATLARDTAIVRRFVAAFGADSAPVQEGRIRRAIAAYERSLTRLDAPVDRALRGQVSIPEEVRAGFNVFVGKGKCASCHFLPLTNGTVPPMYQRSEVEVIGVPERAVTRGARIDPDEGRYRITRAAPHRYAFRTPSVRNVAVTAPYMHNGAYATLEQVIDFYDRGGGAGIGISLDHQTLPPDRLDLSAGERRALTAFLRALTDTTDTTGVPRP
jgi:cytochrome c peroxidase